MVQAILNNDTDICHISKIINAMKTKLRHLAGKAFLSLMKSQCPYEGSNLSLYETGKIALDAGVFQAYDMSTEAVVTKVMWILGKHWERKKREEMFYRNLAGEITLPDVAGNSYKGV